LFEGRILPAYTNNFCPLKARLYQNEKSVKVYFWNVGIRARGVLKSNGQEAGLSGSRYVVKAVWVIKSEPIQHGFSRPFDSGIVYALFCLVVKREKDPGVVALI